MAENGSGVPVLILRATNLSGVASDYFRVQICPLDSAREPIKRNGTGSVCFLGQSNVELNPLSAAPPEGYWYLWEGTYFNVDAPEGEQWWFRVVYPEWTLSGYESATEAIFTLTFVHFVDGTSWSN